METFPIQSKHTENQSNKLYFPCLVHLLSGLTSIVTLVLTSITKHPVGIILSVIILIVSLSFYIKLLLSDPEKRSGQLIQTKLYLYLKILYIIVLVFMVIFLFIAIFNLIYKRTWRDMPEQCDDNIQGCTIVSVGNSTRSGTDIILDDITYSDELLIKTIKEWLGSYIVSYKIFNYDRSIFIHAEITLFWLGFIDDLGIEIYKCSDGLHSSVYAISEQRIGYWDFNVNDQRVLDLYDYLNDMISQRISLKCSSALN